VELYLQSPNMPSWCGGQLKQRDNFTFTFKKLVNITNMNVQKTILLWINSSIHFIQSEVQTQQ